MKSLIGKRVLITGASRGIGRLVARYMAERGCDLVVHGRTAGHLQPLLRELSGFDVSVDVIAADLAETRQVDIMLDRLEGDLQPVDIVFNNAGIQVAYRKDYWHTPVSDFTTSMQVNLIAPVMICLRLLPLMRQRGFGRIINVTSGIHDEPEQSGYAASKAALEKFSRDLASRLENSGVLLNLADPGWCRTDLGGPDAPNDPASSLPGMVVGAFIDDGLSGRIFRAADFAGMSLEAALEYAQAMASKPDSRGLSS